MKRNHPPKESDFCPEREQSIIEARLKELFSPSESERRIPLTNKGYWLHDKRHVKIDSVKGIKREFVKFSRDLRYNYLDPFEALYCLEASQLLVFFNGFPLSLAEAYQLLLDGRNDFINYRVFQHFNRSGFVCSKHIQEESQRQAVETKTKAECCDEIGTFDTQLLTQANLEPLTVADSIIPIKEMLADLRCRGPQEFKLPETYSEVPIEKLKITFNIYKRGTMARDMPRKGKQGNPDYHVIICDKSVDTVPNCKQLLEYDLQMKHSTKTELLFALVDDDMSISCAQIKPLDSNDLTLF